MTSPYRHAEICQRRPITEADPVPWWHLRRRWEFFRAQRELWPHWLWWSETEPPPRIVVKWMMLRRTLPDYVHEEALKKLTADAHPIPTTQAGAILEATQVAQEIAAKKRAANERMRNAHMFPYHVTERRKQRAFEQHIERINDRERARILGRRVKR